MFVVPRSGIASILGLLRCVRIELDLEGGVSGEEGARIPQLPRQDGQLYLGAIELLLTSSFQTPEASLREEVAWNS